MLIIATIVWYLVHNNNDDDDDDINPLPKLIPYGFLLAAVPWGRFIALALLFKS